MADNNLFKEMLAINVANHVEKKEAGKDRNGNVIELSYLSWAYAWAEFKKRVPDAQYKVKTFDNLPYVYDENTGYMVFTEVTAFGVTHEMWLPVMDSNNRAMKKDAYQIKTKYSTITVNAASMFDVNKAIMRCLVKNIAVASGIGLSLYANEDLQDREEPSVNKSTAQTTAQAEINEAADVSVNAIAARQRLVAFLKEIGVDTKEAGSRFKLTNSSTAIEYNTAYEYYRQLNK